MVGYPGETEADFRMLLDFVEEVRFDWLGAFIFSAEEGTAAAGLPGQVPTEVAVSRYNWLLEAQDAVESSAAGKHLGRELEVLVESSAGLQGYEMVGRSYREAPLVDGVIYLKCVAKRPRAGEFARARIIGQEGLDLVGEV